MEIIIQALLIAVSIMISILSGRAEIICGILGGCAAGVFLVSVISRYRRERRLTELTLYLTRLQDQLTLPELHKCTGGQLGILESEIYKLVVLISERWSVADREKSQLAGMLSDISHQIKTPLASITIMTDLLKSPELSKEQREEFTDKIDSQVNRITWLVRNLLTLSQLDADMLKFKREEVSVPELLKKACQPFEILAELKGVELLNRAGEDMRMICDERWTAEAVSNIVKNCIEHTEAGGRVEITANQNNFSTNIIIQDNGEGIEKKHLPHIFERFYKGGNRSEDSVGIGLAMSKQIFMRQNGTISVTSEEGAGTKFHIKMYSEVNV